MATGAQGPSDVSLRDFIEAVGSGDTPHGAVSTAAVAGGLGSSLLLMVAALPQTKSDSSTDRSFLFARPTMNDITGASQAENPPGVPRFRSVIRVPPF